MVCYCKSYDFTTNLLLFKSLAKKRYPEHGVSLFSYIVRP